MAVTPYKNTTLITQPHVTIKEDMPNYTEPIHSIELSATHVVTAYSDGSLAYVVCGERKHGLHLEYGTPVAFTDSGTDHIILTRLSDTKFSVLFEDDGNSGKLTVVAATVSGTAITVDTANETVVDDIGTVTWIGGGVELDTDKIITCSRYGSTTRAVVITFSGTVPTAGTPLQVVANYTTYNTTKMIDKLTTAKAVIVYTANDSLGYAMVLDISGTTITTNTAYQYGTATAVDYPSVAALTDTKVAISWCDDSDANDITKGCIASISGTVITAGTEVSIFASAGGIKYSEVVRIDDTRCAFAGAYGGVSNRYYRAGIASGTNTLTVKNASTIAYDNASSIYPLAGGAMTYDFISTYLSDGFVMYTYITLDYQLINAFTKLNDGRNDLAVLPSTYMIAEAGAGETVEISSIISSGDFLLSSNLKIYDSLNTPMVTITDGGDMVGGIRIDCSNSPIILLEGEGLYANFIHAPYNDSYNDIAVACYGLKRT